MVYDFNIEIGRLFGFPLYWYGAVYTLGFLGVLGWFAARRKRLAWSMTDVLDFVSLMAFCILVGVAGL